MEAGVGRDARGVELPSYHPRRRWKPSEDRKLRALVAKHGRNRWRLICRELEGRTASSCKLRWYNKLDRKINTDVFSEKEEEILVAAHKRYGNMWSQIATFFPGRKVTAVKNQWDMIMERGSPAEERLLHDDGSGSGTASNSWVVLGTPAPPLPQRNEIRSEGVGSASSTPHASIVNPERPTQYLGSLMSPDGKLLPTFNGFPALGSPVQSSSVIGLPLRNTVLGLPLQNSAVGLGTAVHRSPASASATSQGPASRPIGAERRMRIPFIDFMGVGDQN